MSGADDKAYQDQDLEMSRTDPSTDHDHGPGEEVARTQNDRPDQQRQQQQQPLGAHNATMMAPPSAAYFQHPGPLHAPPPHPQHHPMMAPMHMYGPHHAAAAANGGGISWCADVRQIDRTGQTLECIDSETVVSGLTMPTWSAQRPWEAPIYDTPYPDDPNKASSSASYGSKRGRGDDDDGTVKTHWTFWDKPRNRRLCIPFMVLFLAAIGVVVGVMVAGKDTPLTSTNPALGSNPGNANGGTEEPTMAPTRPPRGVGGVIVTTITDSPTISLMPTVAPTNSPTSTPTTAAPTTTPTQAPTVEPGNPTKRPSTNAPTVQPSPSPTKTPSESPTTSEPTKYPSPSPTFDPTAEPTPKPSRKPTKKPSPEPTPEPTDEPTLELSPAPSRKPTKKPSQSPTPAPTDEPTLEPTLEPTKKPTNSPVTAKPSPAPTKDDVPCTICTDERSWWMENIGGMDCDEWEFAYTTRCKHDADWRAAKWCQHSCFVNGAGYAGDNCCVQTMRASDGCTGSDCDESRGDDDMETADPTFVPTTMPTVAATEPVTGTVSSTTSIAESTEPDQ